MSFVASGALTLADSAWGQDSTEPPPDFSGALRRISDEAIEPTSRYQSRGAETASFLQPSGEYYAPPGFEPRGYQNAPGVPEYDPEYRRWSEPVPEYIYDPEYYNTPYHEIKQLADYAPIGYEARDYQSAPGDPEYSPLTPPVYVTQAEREKFVVGGIAPGSFLAPGTNTSVRIRGFVRLAALYDLDPIGLRDAFVPNTIPVPQQSGQNFNMSGRISRFAIETWTPTEWCERTVHTFIEGDFFNGADQAAGGGGNPFRLRHAFFDIGWFRFGQQNSVFMDGTNWPSLVDFQGPNGWTNQRQPSARMTVPLTERLFWASSMERPFSNIAERLTGVGVSGSFVVHPWAVLLGTNPVRDEDPSGLTRSRFLMQTTWGSGIARYINDFAGQGLDGQVDPVTGDFDTLDVNGWHVSYEHWFSDRWLSNVTYSQVNALSIDNQPGTTYDTGKYLATSLWWIPVTRMSFGVEYIWGSRENISGQRAEANRLHGLFQYNF